MKEISVLPFKEQDANELVESSSLLGSLKFFFTTERLKIMARGPAFTVRTSEGRILACIGVVEHWECRGEAWALFHHECKQYFIAIHNAVKRFLEITPMKRIEAVVSVGFERGHRWAKLLGFEVEAEKLSSYLPDGSDVSLYARVKKE